METVKFLDVGHGDCAVIYLKNDEGIENTIVIDIPDSEKLLKELQVNNVKAINCIVISHSDSDHCKGLSDFISKFSQTGKIEKVVFNFDRTRQTKNQQILLKQLLESKSKLDISLQLGVLATEDDQLSLVKTEEVLSIIYPNVAECINPYLRNNTNNMSIVCLLSGRNSKILFTGDLEAEGWKNLLGRNKDLRCDVLKMPHHGAYWESECSIYEIIKHLVPKEVVISTKENRKYQHPCESTMQILNKQCIGIYCTQCTSLCHNLEDNEHGYKCRGDISVVERQDGYDIWTEVDNRKDFRSPACLKE
ncbi:MAG: MBL fold metallo-hydrolase [Lachnospiraceae bacterium]|nr:MBL fold metallo-hydrolase [Lachnospiraceae bacterium]